MTDAFQEQWRKSAADFLVCSARISYYQEVTQRLIDLVPADVRFLLDFGCGGGRFTRLFLQWLPVTGRALAVVLVDYAPEMLALTEDITHPDVRLHRICDDDRLRRLSPDCDGQLDVIACNCSIHVLREADYSLRLDAFMARCWELLTPGGVVLANVPDQDFDFGDGWISRFHAHAQALWPDTPKRASLDKLSRPKLQAVAQRWGFTFEMTDVVLALTWEDFLNFYRIPAMGAGRISGHSQSQRLAMLDELTPCFEREAFRWAFLRFAKQPPLLEATA